MQSLNDSLNETSSDTPVTGCSQAREENTLDAKAPVALASAAPPKAARPRPIDPNDRYELGQVFVKCGWPAKAVYQFVQGLRLDPWDDRGYYAVAHLAAQRGKCLMAHRVLALGLRHVPDSWLLHHALAELAVAPDSSRSPEQQEAWGALHARALVLLEAMRHREVLALLANAYQEGEPSCAALKRLEAEAQERQLAARPWDGWIGGQPL